MTSVSDRSTDLQEIIALTFDYAMALDTKNWDALAECFTPEGVLRSRLAPVSFEGHAAIKAGMREITADLVGNLHPTSNHQYSITGERAAGTCIFVSYQWVGPTQSPGNLRLHAGRYQDELVRTPPGWRFVSRIIDLQCEHEF